MTLVAVDWGTSSLRGARIADDGRVLEERAAPQGILSVSAGGFPAVFEQHFGDWMREPGAQCLISGMAGSRQGWVEAPYCPCPADAQALARQVIDIEPGRISMAPGLSDMQRGVPDVMRGEEVQVFGAMALTGQDSGLFVLPGTHSKWVNVEDGRVMGFRTFMTGEFYALLTQHSILARTLDAQAPLDESAFLHGVRRMGHDDVGLLHHAFGARTQALFHLMAEPALASYLSGLLIGEGLRSQDLYGGPAVVLIGSPALTQRYALALDSLGVSTRSLGAEATWAGLHALHQARQHRSSTT